MEVFGRASLQGPNKFDPTKPIWTDLAQLYGRAKQSTTSTSRRAASNALNTDLKAYSHTLNKPKPWWRVDFEQDSFINTINVTPSQHCCLYRMKGFKVQVFKDGKPVFTYKYPGKDYPKSYTIPVPLGTIGDSVSVSLPGRQFLHLANVKVMGAPVPSTGQVPSDVLKMLEAGIGPNGPIVPFKSILGPSGEIKPNVMGGPDLASAAGVDEAVEPKEFELEDEPVEDT